MGEGLLLRRLCSFFSLDLLRFFSFLSDLGSSALLLNDAGKEMRSGSSSCMGASPAVLALHLLQGHCCMTFPGEPDRKNR